MLGLLESSRSLGEPLTLLYVRYGKGANDVYTFTDSEEPIIIGGLTYTHIAVKIGSVNASGSLDKKSLEVRTPRNNPLVELFRTYPPNEVVTLTISHGHRGDPESEFTVMWTGRILSFGFEGSEAKFNCEPVGTSLRRPGLRRTYSYGCQRVLYSPQCGANKLAATKATTVSAVEGSIVTLPGAWFGAFDPQKFVRGTLEWTTDSGANVVRTILQVNNGSGTGRDLLISGIATGLAPGSSVKAVLGCNHQAGVPAFAGFTAQPNGDCGPLHNNIQNFGGCPWIPTSNPIGVRNNFY